MMVQFATSLEGRNRHKIHDCDGRHPNLTANQWRFRLSLEAPSLHDGNEKATRRPSHDPSYQLASRTSLDIVFPAHCWWRRHPGSHLLPSAYGN